MKNIKQSMPKKKDQVLSSFKIDKDLFQSCKKKLKQNNHTFHDLIETAMKMYLSDN